MGPLRAMTTVFALLLASQAFALDATVTLNIPFGQPPNDGTANPYYVNETFTADEKTAITTLIVTELKQDIVKVLNNSPVGTLTTADVDVTLSTPDYTAQQMYIGFGIVNQADNATFWKTAFRVFDEEYAKYVADGVEVGRFHNLHVLNVMKQCSLLVSPPLPANETIWPALCPSSVPPEDPTKSNSTDVQPCPAGQTRIPLGCSPLGSTEVRMAFHVSSASVLAMGPQGDNTTRNFIDALVAAVPGTSGRIYLHTVKASDEVESVDDPAFPYEWDVIVDVKAGAAAAPSPTALYNSLNAAVADVNKASALSGVLKVRTVEVYKDEGGYVEPTASGVAALVPGFSALLLAVVALLQ